MSRDPGTVSLIVGVMLAIVLITFILWRLMPTLRSDPPADITPSVPVVTATPAPTLWIATLTVTPTATSLPAMLIVSETPPTVTVTVTRAPTESPTPTETPKPAVQRG